MPSHLQQSEQRIHENICRKFLHNAVASTSNCTHSNSTKIVLWVPSTIAGAEICFECWRDCPSRPHALDLQQSCSDGKARGNTTKLQRRLHPHWRVSLLQSLCWVLGQTEVPISKVLVRPGRDTNHAELRPTRHEASTLTTRSHVL